MARVALVAFLVGMMVLGYCSYMLPDSVWQEQTLTPFAYSTLCLFRELAMLTAGLSIDVLARSRTAYRLSRPLAVKTAGCQDRAFCVGAYTLALPFRNEIYLDNISAFDSIHHSTFDARPDSRPLDGEDSQAVLILRPGQIICQDGHYHKKRCCIVICCKLVCYKMLPFWMFRHCFVTY